MKFEACRALALLAWVLSICAAPAAAAPAIDSVMVGTWTFTEDACTDTYEFRDDGTFSSTSAGETLEGTYSSARVSRADPSIVRVARLIVRDNLGIDCTGSREDQSGKSDIRYVKLNSANNEMMVCTSPFADRCFGPLRRTGN